MKRGKRTAPQDEQGDMLAVERSGSTAIAPINPGKLIEQAIKTGLSAEGIERLVRLAREMQADEDRKELARALAKFKAVCPPIPRAANNVATAKAGSFHYWWANLEGIEAHIGPHEEACLLSHSWDTETNGTMMTVFCITTHANGQSKSCKFTLPVTSSAGMSEQQKYVSARSFGKRITLLDVYGLDTTDVPEALVREQDPTPISADQVHALRMLIDEVAANLPKFLKFVGVQRLELLPAVRYGEAVAALQAKRKAAS